MIHHTIRKFEKKLDQMDVHGQIDITLDFHEVANIVAALKAQEVHMKSLEESLFTGFDKAEKQNKNKR